MATSHNGDASPVSDDDDDDDAICSFNYYVFGTALFFLLGINFTTSFLTH